MLQNFQVKVTVEPAKSRYNNREYSDQKVVLAIVFFPGGDKENMNFRREQHKPEYRARWNQAATP